MYIQNKQYSKYRAGQSTTVQSTTVQSTTVQSTTVQSTITVQGTAVQSTGPLNSRTLINPSRNELDFQAMFSGKALSESDIAIVGSQVLEALVFLQVSLNHNREDLARFFAIVTILISKWDLSY